MIYENVAEGVVPISSENLDVAAKVCDGAPIVLVNVFGHLLFSSRRRRTSRLIRALNSSACVLDSKARIRSLLVKSSTLCFIWRGFIPAGRLTRRCLLVAKTTALLECKDELVDLPTNEVVVGAPEFVAQFFAAQRACRFLTKGKALLENGSGSLNCGHLSSPVWCVCLTVTNVRYLYVTVKHVICLYEEQLYMTVLGLVAL